jgi:hypothetical protein
MNFDKNAIMELMKYKKRIDFRIDFLRKNMPGFCGVTSQNEVIWLFSEAEKIAPLREWTINKPGGGEIYPWEYTITRDGVKFVCLTEARINFVCQDIVTEQALLAHEDAAAVAVEMAQ